VDVEDARANCQLLIAICSLKTKKERQVLLSFVSPPGGGNLRPVPAIKLLQL